MKSRLYAPAILAAILLPACASTSANTAPPASVAADLEPCLIQAQDMMVGTWDYMSVIERISGGYRTWGTRSVHGKTADGLYTSRSFGGDMEAGAGDEIEYERVSGNQILPVEDGTDQTDRARTFLTCTGPDDVGRIKTTSVYEFPFDEEGTEMLYAENYSSFSAGGTFFFEEVRNEDGEIVARVSGTTTPVDGG